MDDFEQVLRLSRYGAAAFLLAVLWTLEAVAPMFADRRRRLSHGATNLGLALINGLVAYGAAFAILFVMEVARERSIGLLNQVDVPVWLQWTLALVLLDCWQYWWHRLNHRVPLLWRFHAVHHSDAELDVTSGVRFHTIEIMLSMVARLAVLPLIGLTVPQLLVYEALSLLIVLFHHSNVRVPNGVDVCLRWLIVTPWIHWVHHSQEKSETDSNYSSFLSVWDRLFGSFRWREDPWEIKLGLRGWEEREWRGLWGSLGAPFLKSRKREEPDAVTPSSDQRRV